MQFFYSMFMSPDGKVSSMRFGFLLALFFVMVNWTYVNFKKMELQPIPDNAVMLVVGLGGMRAVQGFSERPLTSYQKSGNIKT